MNVFQFFITCKRTNNANNATHYVKLGKKRPESSKRNYYINSPSVIIKAIIITVLFNVGSFPSLGEEPGKFFDSVLGFFMPGLMADAQVEGDVAFVVIDVIPPMATSVHALHQDDDLKDFHHIDSIAYFKALPDGLQKIFTMNHDAIVKFLCSQREQILEAAAAHH